LDLLITYVEKTEKIKIQNLVRC